MPWTKLQADAIGRDDSLLARKGDRRLTYREAIREAQEVASLAPPLIWTKRMDVTGS